MRGGRTTRRTFILAASTQIASPFAFAAPGENAGAPAEGNIGPLVSAYTFRTPNEFPGYFFTMWHIRVSIALARVDERVNQELNGLVIQAQGVLEREKTITTELAARVAIGTSHLQNAIMGVATDIKSGIVDITVDKFQTIRDYYCSFYPYCNR
jgi:hypothetical protein